MKKPKEYKKNRKNKDSFLLDMWEVIFRILSFVSIFFVIRKIKKNITSKILLVRKD